MIPPALTLSALLLSLSTAPIEPQGSSVTFTGEYRPESKPLALWSRKPATRFEEAYPVGNGRSGAVMFAGVPVERVILTESSLWSGSAQSADRAGGAAKLPEIEKLLQDGKNGEAEKLLGESFVGNARGKDTPFGSFQALGELEVTMLEPEGTPMAGEVKGYRRTLDVEQGAAWMRYQHSRATYTHRVYSNIPQNVVVYRIAAGDRNHAISFDARLKRSERAKSESYNGVGLLLTGSVSNGKGGDGTKFSARLQCEQRGGKLTSENGVLSVRGADEVMMVIAMGTDYAGPIAGQFAGAGHAEATALACERSIALGYNELWKDHMLQNWKPLFMDRTQLQMAGPDRTSVAPVVRFKATGDGESDPQLATLLFQYGRYLTIAGTRGQAMPLNGVGLWTGGMEAPSNGAFAIGSGLELGYQGAPATYLSDFCTPLTELVLSLVEPGKKTAQAYYGAKGWVAHDATNAWGSTSPGDRPSSPTGGASLANACFDVYEHSQDVEALRKLYPALKGAAEFFADVLVEDPKTKTLVTPYSVTENAFKLDGGKTAHVSMGSTRDVAIVRELFANTIEAARKLSVDPELAKTLEEKRARLAPIRAGKNGLMEWIQDFEPADAQARDVSSLYALYPASQINVHATPELAKAAKMTLERSGDTGTPQMLAWKAAAWARLGEGDRALRTLGTMMRPTGELGMNENLVAGGASFDVAANLAATAAITEMFVQSYREKDGEEYTLHLLPALPSSWPTGEVHNLGARGGLAVSIHWKDGKLEHAHIYRGNAQAGNVRVRYPGPLRARTNEGADPGSTYVDGVLVFNLESQKTVEVEATN